MSAWAVLQERGAPQVDMGTKRPNGMKVWRATSVKKATIVKAFSLKCYAVQGRTMMKKDALTFQIAKIVKRVIFAHPLHITLNVHRENTMMR
jgi:hypothetical protein